MKIVEPSVEFITEPNPLKRVELCGRVCYKSENRITPDSAKKFVAGIIKRGHTSVLEHARIEVPYMTYYRITREAVKNHIPDPYGLVDRTPEYPGNCAVMNARDFIALGGTLDDLEQLQHSPATSRYAVFSPPLKTAYRYARERRRLSAPPNAVTPLKRRDPSLAFLCFANRSRGLLAHSLLAVGAFASPSVVPQRTVVMHCGGLGQPALPAP